MVRWIRCSLRQYFHRLRHLGKNPQAVRLTVEEHVRRADESVSTSIRRSRCACRRATTGTYVMRWTGNQRVDRTRHIHGLHGTISITWLYSTLDWDNSMLHSLHSIHSLYPCLSPHSQSLFLPRRLKISSIHLNPIDLATNLESSLQVAIHGSTILQQVHGHRRKELTARGYHGVSHRGFLPRFRLSLLFSRFPPSDCPRFDMQNNGMAAMTSNSQARTRAPARACDRCRRRKAKVYLAAP